MSKQGPLAKPVKPKNMQLLHQEIIDGIPIRVYASNWYLFVRVFLFPDLTKSMELTIPSKTYLTMTLREIIDRSIDEAKKQLPASKSLSPKPITL